MQDLTPTLLHRRDPRRYPCLLESVTAGESHARHDILLIADGGQLVAEAGDDHSFLQRLDDWWSSLRNGAPRSSETLPFVGGWFLYLGYELAGEIEPRLQLPRPGSLPVAAAVRCPAALIRDHATGETRLVAEPGHEALAAAVRADIEALANTDDAVARPLLAEPMTEEPPQAFIDGVHRIRHYITEGDVFQVNLSRAWRGRLAGEGEGDAVALYRRLRDCNPAPFAALARIGTTSIISSSPERLIRIRDGLIETRPIAGTRPRGADSVSDRALSDRLLAHPKERAEHIMLIDLERNDLGRVCVPGSIEVSELMSIESYAHVHHIVSNVRGRLRDDVTPGAAIRATFPGGTITGCPKVRCMEIINELEHSPRGPYTGSLGYLGRDGSLDLNILIRTLELDGDRLTLRAGAGIVADSIADRELDETRSKARGILQIFDE